jgi:hypothetical protein
MKPARIMIDEVAYVREDSISYTPRKEGVWEIGKAYLIRTVTMIQHGVLVEVTPQELVLIKASWIADTGRFADFVSGKILPNEAEPFPQNSLVIVSRGALIDAVQLSGCFDKQI